MGAEETQKASGQGVLLQPTARLWESCGAAAAAHRLEHTQVTRSEPWSEASVPESRADLWVRVLGTMAMLCSFLTLA